MSWIIKPHLGSEGVNELAPGKTRVTDRGAFSTCSGWGYLFDHQARHIGADHVTLDQHSLRDDPGLNDRSRYTCSIGQSVLGQLDQPEIKREPRLVAQVLANPPGALGDPVADNQ